MSDALSGHHEVFARRAGIVYDPAMIHRLLIFTIVCVTTLRADESGFVSLFNGKDLDGWTTREAIEGDWSVVEGVIDCDPKGEGKGDRNLWTVKEFGEFELQIDWRIKESP